MYRQLCLKLGTNTVMARRPFARVGSSLAWSFGLGREVVVVTQGLAEGRVPWPTAMARMQQRDSRKQLGKDNNNILITTHCVLCHICDTVGG